MAAGGRRLRDATADSREIDSGAAVPGDEVGKQLKTGAVAFLGMELHGKDISACNRASKRRRIVDAARRSSPRHRAPDSSCARSRSGGVGDAAPQADARCPLAHAGSSPCAAPSVARPWASTMRCVGKALDLSPQQPRHEVGPSSLSSNSICRPRQMPRNGRSRATSATTSRKPLALRQRMQSGIALCPGRTTRSALVIVAGSALTTMVRSGATCAQRLGDRAQGCRCRSRRRRCRASEIRNRESELAETRSYAFVTGTLRRSCRSGRRACPWSRERCRAARGSARSPCAAPVAKALNTVSA